MQGTHIEVVTNSSRGLITAEKAQRFVDTDGLITNIADVPLFIFIADCAALSFFDPKRNVIGIGHADWRGTVAGIAQKMVAAINGAFDCNPADILVGISPSIGPVPFSCSSLMAPDTSICGRRSPVSCDQVVFRQHTLS